MPTAKNTVRAPYVSVIVVTHNSAKWIDACLNAIFAQRFERAFEVIVVDSGSSDATTAIVKKKFPKARLEQVPNRGFGAGNNVGAKLAKGEILAFANPDTVADPDWLRELVAAIREPRTVATSQVLLADDPTKINTMGLDLHFLGFSFVRGYGRLAIDADPGEVPGFSGAAFAMRRDEYLALGGFDETIFLYGEDAELSWRARREAYRIVAVPRSRIRHHYSWRMDAAKLYHLERSRRLIVRKHHPRWRRILFAPSRLVAAILVNRFAAAYGLEGKDAVRRARKGPIDVKTPTRHGSTRFARRTIPFRTAFPTSRAARWLGFAPNLVFAIDGPWTPRRKRWLHVAR
jgi:GT2 family glycosyltransferase